MKCRWTCERCHQRGDVTITDVYRRPDESDAKVVERFSTQARASCVTGCGYSVWMPSPQEPTFFVSPEKEQG